MNTFLTATVQDLVKAIPKTIPMSEEESQDVAGLMIRIQFLDELVLRPDIQVSRIRRLLTIVRLENMIARENKASIPPKNT